MHVRVSCVTRHGKTYRYAQLVETFRRPTDGMPAHRVIAALGDPDSLDVQNLRAALAAARDGKRVAVVRHTRAANSVSLKPTVSLRYLDLAVLLSLWHEVGLDELLTELLPQGGEQVAPASIVAALVLQRCVDPGSKLYAARWMPRTALPELLGIVPEQFNNTRLHRVLDDLDDVTSGLMAKLPHRYVARDGKFASLFLDVSDTWFVGDGPALAAKGKTKEGRIEKKIGIVLLCNQDGLPIRWDVISGSQADPTAMTRMLQSVRNVSWAEQVPIVCDRSMGTTAMVRGMLETDLRFVTALTKNEFDAYAPALPHAAFASLAPHSDSFDTDVANAIECASASGLDRHTDDLFVLDLGIVERADVGQSDHTVAPGSNADVMRLAREIEEAVGKERFASYAAAGRPLGLGKRSRREVSNAPRTRRATAAGRARRPLRVVRPRCAARSRRDEGRRGTGVSIRGFAKACRCFETEVARTCERPDAAAVATDTGPCSRGRLLQSSSIRRSATRGQAEDRGRTEVRR